MAGVVGCVVGHPFDTLKLQQQTSRTGLTMLESYHKLVRNMGGQQALWRGIGPALAVQVVTSGFLFGTQASIVDSVSSFFGASSRADSSSGSSSGSSTGSSTETALIDSSYRLQQAMSVSSVTCATISGFLTGGLLAPIVCPLEGFKCRAQVAAAQVHTNIVVGASSPSALAHPLRTMRRVYAGFIPSVLRCSFGNAAFFGVYAWSQSAQVNPAVGGALAGAFFWIAGMPFDVLKSRMQTQNAISSGGVLQQQQLPTLTQTCLKIHKEVGIRGFYAGLPVTLMRAVPMNAAVLFTYELVLRHFKT